MRPAGLLIWKPWQTPALASVKENSIGIIDPSRNEVIGEVAVGTSPGGIAVGEGYAWVTNTGADTVSQINLRTRAVEGRIDVGRAPKGIAVAAGSVWVANSGERTVSRINIATGRVVGGRIEVGNAPTAIVAGPTSLWVANATDSTVVSIDAQTGEVGSPIAVGATPIALAVDDAGLWVASEDGASVTHLDPSTGLTRAAPIQLAARPSAIALGSDSVWVAATDGTVTRVDREHGRVTATIEVGGSLAAIAANGDSIWLGDHDGSVYRLSAANTSSPPTRIATRSAVAALIIVNEVMWLVAQASTASHRGGTLRIVQNQPDGFPRYKLDPLDSPFYNVAQLQADGLVGYRRQGGAAGSVLLADLATSVPTPTNGGLTYAFQLRPGLQYSSGEPVRASDFRRSIERSFQVSQGFFGLQGPYFFPAIDGADACTHEDGTAVERCDLSAGVSVDDVAGTVIFNLTSPDPDFVAKLAHPTAYPVPEGVPMNDLVTGAFPGTGPYVVAEMTDNEVRLGRNSHFRVWDAAVRPDGFPDEIVFTVVDDDATRIAMGRAR